MATHIEELEDEKLTPEERAVTNRRAAAELWPYLVEHKRGLILCLILLAIGTGFSLWWPVLLKSAFDVNLKANDYRGLVFTALLIFGLQAMTLFLQYIQRVKLEIIGQDVMKELKQKLFSHILSLDVSFFDRYPVGKLMARVESDAEALRMMFTQTAVVLVSDVLLIVGTFSLMGYYSWKLTLILLALFPLMGFMVWLFEKKTSPRFLEVRKKTSEVIAMLTEFFHGLAVVQIFDRRAWAIDKLNTINREKFRNDAYGELGVVVFVNTLFLMQYVMTAIVLGLGVYWIKNGTLTVGVISMFVILIWRLFEPIMRTSEQMSNIQKALAGSKRIVALLATPAHVVDPINPIEWPGLREGIRFENVWFSYTKDEHWILKDVSFEIPKGKRVALAGVTGGGKSTVISLILRYYDPQKGRILVDGVDIREMSQADLRKKFALVLQDILLFPGDVRSNIALSSEEHTDAAVRSAAETVDADRFIDRLPQKYATEVSEKGSNFSRGERQLLSFARALVVNPDVLILDEATSSVDPETERTIQDSLKKLMSNRTSLIIAHRLSTILDVDQILVIRQGEIVERGTHTELILQNGYYSRLFHLQFKPKVNGELRHAG